MGVESVSVAESPSHADTLEISCLTLSGRIGKVAALHAAVACSSPAEVTLIYIMHVALRGCCQ